MGNTLSIIPSDNVATEFPVLKAFQEYIDAEQTKARKRMLGLSVFFIVLLIVIVITFVLVLTTVVNRNQALSDRLLDYALKERERKSVSADQVSVAPIPSPQQSIQELLLPFIERLEREQSAIKEHYEKKQQEIEAQIAEKDATHKQEMERIRTELEKEHERKKKEIDRQEVIERHRRRLYPEYYNPTTPYTSQMQMRTQDNPAPPPTNIKSPDTTPPKPSKTLSKKDKKFTTNPLSDIKPVTYFNIDDEENVPFLIETPANKVPPK